MAELSFMPRAASSDDGAELSFTPREIPVARPSRLERFGAGLKELGSELAEVPGRVGAYLQGPSALEQSAKISEKVMELGPRNPEVRRLRMENPMNFAFAPGEGLARSPVPGAQRAPGLSGSVLSDVIRPSEQKAAEAASARTEKLADKAGDIVAKKFAEDEAGGGLSAQEALTKMEEARAAGKPLTLADLGSENTRGLAGNVARAPGPARNMLKTFMDTRDSAANARLTDDVGKYVANGSVRKTAQELAQARSENARPLWDKAMAVGPVWNDRIQAFLDDKDIQQGIRHGLELERRNALAENRKLDPADYAITGFNEAGDPIISGKPTMKLLAVAKEGLDKMLGNPDMRDPLTGKLTKDGIAVDKVRRSFLNELDTVNPDYATARSQWSGDTASLQALRDGRELFKPSNKAEDIAADFSKLSPNDKEFFRLGAADAIREKIDATGIGGDEAKSLIRNEGVKKRLGILFDDDASFNKFVDAVTSERTMFDTRREVLGGSQTAGRLMEDATANVRPMIEGARGAAHLMAGNPLASIGSFLRARRDLGMIPNPALNQEIAKILTNTDLGLPGGPSQTLLRSFPGPKTQNLLLQSLRQYRQGP